jgi:hypothetical protein
MMKVRLWREGEVEADVAAAAEEAPTAGEAADAVRPPLAAPCPGNARAATYSMP